MKILSFITLYIFLSCTGQLLLRSGARIYEPLINESHNINVFLLFFTNKHILFGVGAWIAATILWLMVLSQMPLSFAYCLTSISYLVIPLLSWQIFNESVSSTRIGGMLIIFVGVLVTLYGRFLEMNQGG